VANESFVENIFKCSMAVHNKLLEWSPSFAIRMVTFGLMSETLAMELMYLLIICPGRNGTACRTRSPVVRACWDMCSGRQSESLCSTLDLSVYQSVGNVPDVRILVDFARD
jgi:hypothetical protein